MYKYTGVGVKIFFLIICVLQFFYIYHYRSGFKNEIIKSPFDAEAGILYALPIESIELKKILKKRDLKFFNLSESFKKDKYLYQRIIEFNYPLRLDESSSLLFYMKDEKIPENCTIIETSENLKLIRC